MKLEGYKSGMYTKVEDYKAFILSKINYNWGWENTKLNKLVAEASRELGELNAYSLSTPNIDTYIKMYVKVEANKSNLIDGRDATVEESLIDFKEVAKEKASNIEEMKNCEKAIFYGVEKVAEGETVNTNLIKDIHKILMQGKNEEHKRVGELRNSQNWIGGNATKDAEFVPPPHTEIVECLADFEKFINNDDTDTPDLVKIAMLHYQFETIHPFMSGNGRIGRIIIPLYLQSKGMLDKSCLYISNYLEKNKSTYFDKLNKVRNSSDIIGWIQFFLEAIIETAKTEKEQLKKLAELSKEIEEIINDLPVKLDNARKVVDVLYDYPIVSRKKVLENSGMKPSTLNTTINSMLEKNILEEITGQGRNQIFAFRRYIKIFLDS